MCEYLHCLGLIYWIVDTLHVQKEPCLCNDLFEGIIFLSEAVLESAEYSDQYCSVLGHALNLMEEASQRHRNESSMMNRITHILKSRFVN